MDPKGKVALINGGARIGQTVAASLARRGTHLAVTYRSSREAAEATVTEARRLGVKAEAFQADAGDENQIADAVERTVSTLGGLDILVNMASVYEKSPIEQVGAADWSRLLQANAGGALLFCVKAIPFMRKAGSGRIINFSDWLPVSGRPRYSGYVPYYAAKAAVVGLTQSLALELAPEILVNAVAPGPILPPPDLPADENARVVAATPLRRWGGATEIAKAVLFLVETDFVTGECIRVDGGRHLY